jgi:hypothetical protein
VREPPAHHRAVVVPLDGVGDLGPVGRGRPARLPRPARGDEQRPVRRAPRLGRQRPAPLADARRLERHWTPVEQARYEAQDIDVGSTSPAYLGHGLVLQGGKDAKLHLIALKRMHGVRGAAGRRLGGELQVLPTPGGAEMFTAAAVWPHDGRTTVFVATGAGTTAYSLQHRRLQPIWGNRQPGTSPILAGGLLYVYDPTGGGVVVYDPGNGNVLRTLDAGEGHWNSPAIASGHLVLGVGNANDHEARDGVLDVWSAD